MPRRPSYRTTRREQTYSGAPLFDVSAVFDELGFTGREGIFRTFAVRPKGMKRWSVIGRIRRK